MAFYEIPREEWAAFGERLAEEHRGEHVTVSVLPPAAPGGTEVLAEGVPFTELELARGERGDELIIELEERLSDAHASIVVREPARVRIEQERERAPGRLRLVERDGRTVLVDFPGPILPGFLGRRA